MLQLRDCCVYMGSTILEAITVIQNSNNRCMCVITKSNRLIGVLSQGDIMRALIDGLNLYSLIDSIINQSFVYLNNREMDKAYLIMRDKGLTLLPIIDNEFHLTDVITNADMFQYIDERIDGER